MSEQIKLFTEAYERYWEMAAKRAVKLPCTMVPYTFNQEQFDFVYSGMEKEFTRELLNTLNAYGVQINKLTLWAEVLKDCVAENSLDLRYEFTRIPLYYCLHQPKEFQQRLIYSAAHLCHQANLHIDRMYQDELVSDDLIGKKVLLRVISPWTSGNSLMAALEGVADKGFQQSTRFYRNKAQHRIPPCLEYGHSNFITRSKHEDGTVSYGFGFVEAITTEEALPVLTQEWDAMRAAFNAYWDLVSEHTSRLKDKYRK